MAKLTVSRPKPVVTDATYILELNQDEALLLAGILGSGLGLLGPDTYFDLFNELEADLGGDVEVRTHSTYRRGLKADLWEKF